MIVAIVGLCHSYELLPYYLEHYRGLGVDRFLVACEPDALDPSGGLRRVLASQGDVEVVALPAGFRRSNLVGMIEEEVRARTVTAGDWVIPADLDELNRYPADLRGLVAEMERDGSDYVAGEMRDRLAPEGLLRGLLPFERGVSIWEQYPLEADVTGRIAGGATGKVLLSRGDLAWGMGHHRMREAAALKAFRLGGVAHHFKWRAGLLEALAWRIENEERARLPWSRESARLSEYLREHGRVVPEDVGAAVGWRPA